jgi:hypothetical protein
MLLGKIKSHVASSKLLFQHNFDKASDEGPFSAHGKAIFAAVLLLLSAIVLVMAPGRSDYRVAQSLLKSGLTTIGTVERVNVESRRSGKAGWEYITAVDYRFVGPDKQIHRGSSSYTGPKPQSVVAGDSIEVLHDPHRPNISGWRTALQGTEATVHIGVVLFSLVSLCCLFWLHRYARWRRYRRSPAT